MSGFAIVTLVGNVVCDPELKTLPGDTDLAEFSVAVSEYRKNDDDYVSYFDVKVFGGAAGPVSRYLIKGDQVTIHGRLTQQRWEAQDGTKRNRVEIVAREVVFPQRGRTKKASTAERDPMVDKEYADIMFGGD